MNFNLIKRERDEVVKRTLLGNVFFYQKILRRDGSLYGIEILTRFNNDLVPNGQTDYTIFLEGIEFLFETGAFSSFSSFGLKIHFNLFPATIPLIQWQVVSSFAQGVLVIEILERGIGNYLSYIDYLKENSFGLKVALDDFGKGDSNFAVIDHFDIIKVDCEIVKNCCWFADYIKRTYLDKEIILEKSNDIVKNPSLFRKCKADAYQCFSLHKPEVLTSRKLKELLSEVGKGK